LRLVVNTAIDAMCEAIASSPGRPDVVEAAFRLQQRVFDPVI